MSVFLSVASLLRREYVGAEVVLVCAPSSIGALETVISRKGLSIVKLPQQRIPSLNDAHVSIQQSFVHYCQCDPVPGHKFMDQVLIYFCSMSV